MLQHVQKILNFLIRYLELQLFITIITLPVLILWGLPISLMIFISNLIFHPFLFCFLFISSLIFFTELIFLPNSLLIYLLEIITASWHWILNKSSSTWIIPLPSSSFLLLAIAPLVAFVVLLHPFFNSKLYRPIAFAIILQITILLLRFQQPGEAIAQIPCGNGALTVIHANNNITLIDPGFLKQIKEDWIEYTLASVITKNYGTLTIEHLIILQISTNTFKIIQALSRCFIIKKIYIPYWYGEHKQSMMRAYGAARHMLEKQQTSITRIPHRMSIAINNNIRLSMKKTTEKISYHEVYFYKFQVIIHHLNKIIEINSGQPNHIDNEPA